MELIKRAASQALALIVMHNSPTINSNQVPPFEKGGLGAGRLRYVKN